MSADLARIGRALGAPARAAMIHVLLDGAPHSAGELARAAGVSSATASEHLAVLVAAGLAGVEQDGRHRRFTMTDPRIAQALELLGGPAPEPVTSLRLSREQQRVRRARTCYDHLAGLLGVALTERLVTLGWVDAALTTVTPAGRVGLAGQLGIHLDDARPTRRPLLRACRDWTERRDHVAGVLGARLAAHALADGWVLRKPGSRGLTVTAHGEDVLGALGVRLP
ncbi:helix-turn-helix domain-containing protein [Pimelobacter simplex]|uniref:Transcriptional regulator, ArsR family n=1 Tax=Nocardioides simplex TaxID=2045 RepID=A0A0A1DGM5_NOCSI|nr:helix-turn-helix transcriptional regulator [Pimelobacter simplex]AIY16439.1 Transcriptional regulator, ArsR family [Pimelobacter simplex]MCG8152878.1 helix-turn-helix domain-containing protein [Pimelobacter simplex]GEB11848.1 transcriptional regulator [Pimelobacter simplex]SFN02546.1 transcriptional regulator, ArsR family [Pimelobacter simplex]